MFKNKKFGLLLVVLMLIVPMALAACGDDDKDEKKGDSKVELNQTFESVTGLTAKYPEGWVTQDTLMPMIANSEAALNAEEIGEGMAAVMFMPVPSDQLMGMSVKEAFEMMGGAMAGEIGEGGEASDVKEIKIAGKDGYRIDIKDAQSEGFVVGFEGEGGALILGIGATGNGKLGDFESTMLAIIESATYTAPAAE